MKAAFTIPNFSRQAKRLRREFLDVYSDPRISHPKRFLWDHWHIEGQYTLHRTLAREFFSEKAFLPFLETLVRYGQDHLGCHSISEPWLSYYTEGDGQHLHSDSPHGPWAYVFSLTDWSRRQFQGGETILLKPEILDFWGSLLKGQHGRNRGLESGEIFTSIAPRFNQLTVFDPRIPHGVRHLTGGVREPSQGRLVIHGWFVNPEPYVIGGLRNHSLTGFLNSEIPTALEKVAGVESVRGIATFQFQIGPGGQIKRLKVLTSNLRDRSGVFPKNLEKSLVAELKKIQFPRARSNSVLTLPLIVD